MKQIRTRIGLFISCGLFANSMVFANDVGFEEKLPAYGLIKPGKMTTMLAVNHGIVSKINAQVGQGVRLGEAVIEVMEKETTRVYKTTISGGVAKLHVTNGGAVTPGMPLTTVIDPQSKVIEVSLSPKEAERVSPGLMVSLRRTGGSDFGKIERVSPLVDPDTGAVLAFVKAKGAVRQLIGDIVPLDITLRVIDGCKVVLIREIDAHLENHVIEAVTGNQACLKPKK